MILDLVSFGSNYLLLKGLRANPFLNGRLSAIPVLLVPGQELSGDSRQGTCRLLPERRISLINEFKNWEFAKKAWHYFNF